MRMAAIKLMVPFVAMVLGTAGCGGGGGGAEAPPVKNTPPVADAGGGQTVASGAVVTLDGSKSADADGDLLTYSWSFASRPGGSNAALTGPVSLNPTFTPDVAGAYVINLTVNDGKVSSAAATVTVTASDPAPQADIAPPAVTAQISGTTISASGTYHLATLPASVTFFTNEPATIYYTTNGSEPTTASAAVNVSAGSASGPSISVTDTILKFFGVDRATNSSAIVTGILKSP